MRKLVVVFSMALMVGTLCSCSVAGQEASSEADAVAQGASSEGLATIANPWAEAPSAQAAAESAGIDGFSVMNTLEVAGREFSDPTYLSMNGLVEAYYDDGDARLSIRKAVGFEPSEMAGDYNDYPASWVVNVKALEVECQGAQEGLANLATWSVDGVAYAINLVADEGEAIGLTDNEMFSLVNGMQ